LTPGYGYLAFLGYILMGGGEIQAISLVESFQAISLVERGRRVDGGNKWRGHPIKKWRRGQLPSGSIGKS